MKTYTNLEQSKKLAEMSIEGADMYYPNRIDIKYQGALPIEYKHGNPLLSQEIAAWSLAALLSVLPEPQLTQNSIGKWMVRIWDKNNYPWSVGGHANPVDACYEMILKLRELKLL